MIQVKGKKLFYITYFGKIASESGINFPWSWPRNILNFASENHFTLAKVIILLKAFCII